MSEYRSDIQGQRAVLYARVSTDDQGQTTETQKIAMEQWCRSKGVEIAAYYQEEMTGTTLNRPELKRAMSECMFGGADILLAYDQSRITRGNDLDDVIRKISPARLMFVVTGEMSADSLIGTMVNSVQGAFDQYENKVRRDKTKMGLATRRDVENKHIGRPAKFMFAEDLDDSYDGRSRPEHSSEDGKRVIPATKIITESQFYGYARDGYSLSWVAKNVLGVSKSALLAEIKLREDEPSYRLREYAKKYAEPVFPDDYIPFYRFKGKKDRYTPYMTLYEQTIAVRKGLSSESVEKTDEIGSEREGLA